MIRKLMALMIGIGLTLCVLSTGLADESKTPQYMSEEEYVREIIRLDSVIQNHIQNKRLLKIHQPAFKAHELAKALLEKRNRLAAKEKQGDDLEKEGESREKLASVVKLIGQTAKLLDKYGDAEDLNKTKIVYKKFRKAVDAIKSLYLEVEPSSK